MSKGSRDPRNNKKELAEMQRLKQENQKLKRQLNRLRKQVDRVDLDRYSNLREVMDAQKKEDGEYEEKMRQKIIVDKWVCFSCGRDYLRIVIIQRPDGDFYFRKCPTCENRTRMQRLNEQVQGPSD